MLLTYKLVFFFYIFTTFVASVPLANNATLFANGLEAQRLNAQFQMLRPSDSCPIGHNAFSRYSFRKILNPLLTTTGTTITCTSLKTADGIIGGIAGSNSTSSPDHNDGGKGANATMTSITTGSIMTSDTTIPTHFEDYFTSRSDAAFREFNCPY